MDLEGKGETRQILTNKRNFFSKKWQVDRKRVKSRAHSHVCGEGQTVRGWFGEGGMSVWWEGWEGETVNRCEVGL